VVRQQQQGGDRTFDAKLNWVKAKGEFEAQRSRRQRDLVHGPITIQSSTGSSQSEFETTVRSAQAPKAGWGPLNSRELYPPRRSRTDLSLGSPARASK
jgi:hypothetical protein